MVGVAIDSPSLPLRIKTSLKVPLKVPLLTICCYYAINYLGGDDMPTEKREKEEIVASLLVELPLRQYAGGSQGKQLALERYMRTLLRSLTYFELEFEEKMMLDNGLQLSPPMLYRLDKASRGYDAFMEKRGKVSV